MAFSFGSVPPPPPARLATTTTTTAVPAGDGTPYRVGNGTINVTGTNYVNSMNCTWVISPLAGTSVRVIFTAFNVRGGCFLDIYMLFSDCVRQSSTMWCCGSRCLSSSDGDQLRRGDDFLPEYFCHRCNANG
jgi:hypothetical protein